MAVAPVAWEWVKRGAALVAKTPGWAGHAVLGTLSTPAGYSSAVQAVSAGIKVTWRLLDRAVCLTGRGLAIVTGLAASGVRHVAPTWGQALVAAHADLVDAVNATHEHLTHRISRFGVTTERLADTKLVKSVSTRAAAIASALLVAHVITKGVLATKALTVAPVLAGLVFGVTSPWWLLAAVAGVSLSAMGWAAYASASSEQEISDLVVSVAADGSVTVTGIPGTMPMAERHRVAGEASEKALASLNVEAGRNLTMPSRSRSRRPNHATRPH